MAQSSTFYRQCRLARGQRRTYSWLPEKYAKQGKYLKLREKGRWENGWCVESVGAFRMSEISVDERSQDYKHQRRASDI